MQPGVETITFNGQECLRLAARDGSSAVVCRHGAHVLSWIDAAGAERLFLSERAVFDGKAAIRGGVPICFPQFSGLGKLPKHGFVRNRAWVVGERGASGDAASVTLETCDDAASRTVWPHGFRAALTARLAPGRLDMTLAVTNTGNVEFDFTGALHTYFAVDDIGRVAITGLSGREYRDAAGGNAIRVEAAPVLGFASEVDRVYHEVDNPLELRDGTRRLRVSGSGFRDVVVWNPWAALCAGLADMAPDGYRRMVCIEAAAARVPVRVPAGDTWTGAQGLETLPTSG